jgi:hypothetical protein
MMAMWNTNPEAMKIEKDPGMMQSVEEHQEMPTEDAAVVPVKGLRKRHRGRKLTAGRRGQPKEGTRGYYGSRTRVTVPSKRTFRHATVAWLKRKLFRRSWIQESHESLKEFAAGRMRKSQEGNKGIRHRDVKELPHLSKKRKTTNGIKGWSAGQRFYLGSGETPNKNSYKIFGGKIIKQIVETSRRL